VVVVTPDCVVVVVPPEAVDVVVEFEFDVVVEFDAVVEPDAVVVAPDTVVVVAPDTVVVVEGLAQFEGAVYMQFEKLPNEEKTLLFPCHALVVPEIPLLKAQVATHR